jgi:hypothetical protein
MQYRRDVAWPEAVSCCTACAGSANCARWTRVTMDVDASGPPRPSGTAHGMRVRAASRNGVRDCARLARRVAARATRTTCLMMCPEQCGHPTGRMSFGTAVRTPTRYSPNSPTLSTRTRPGTRRCAQVTRVFGTHSALQTYVTDFRRATLARSKGAAPVTFYASRIRQ